jgi:hypothetical protein
VHELRDKVQRKGHGSVRKINPDLKAYLDEKLGVEVIADDAVTLMIKAATVLIGITDDTDPRAVDWFRDTVAKPQGEAWCSDFVQSCIAYVEAVKGIVSTVAASEGVLDMWDKSRAENAATPAARGDIVIWRLGKTVEGHCGLITAIDSLLYETIEGNTSDAPNMDRMGRGVFAKKRAKGGTKTFTEAGLLRPFR